MNQQNQHTPADPLWLTAENAAVHFYDGSAATGDDLARRQYAFSLGYYQARKGCVAIPGRIAQLVRSVFLPRNPNKLRNCTPEVIDAAKDFIARCENEAANINSHASLVAENKRLTETNGVLVKALKMQDTDIPYSRKLEWVYRGLKAAGGDMPPLEEIHAMQREDVLLRVIQWASEAAESERARVGANPDADAFVPSWLPELEAAIEEASK